MSSETSTVAAAAVRTNFLKSWLTRLGPFLGLALVILIFTALSDTP